MNGADIFFFRWKVQFKITIFFSRCHSKFRQRLKSWVHKSNDFIHSATLPFWYPNNILPEQKYKTDRFLVHVIFSKPTNSQREEEGGLEDEFRLRKSWTKRPMAGARTRGRTNEHLYMYNSERMNERPLFLFRSQDSCVLVMWVEQGKPFTTKKRERERENEKEKERKRKRKRERESDREQSPSDLFMNRARMH
jgi:hypothetical protein